MDEYTPTEDERRTALVAGLREAADFIEATPDLAVPHHASLTTYLYGTRAKPGLADAARALGKARKSVNEHDFVVSRSFGPVEIAYHGWREAVCERVEVGRRTVERQVPVGDVEYVTVAEDEPVYEWVCPPSLLADDTADEPASVPA